MQTSSKIPRTRSNKAAKVVKASLPDDFISVARRLGADESKERFEKKLKKIARSKVPKADQSL